MKQPFLAAVLLACGLAAACGGTDSQPAAGPGSGPGETAAADSGMRTLSYTHVVNGVHRYGSFSMTGREAMATWTVTEGGDKQVEKVAMTPEAFEKAWAWVGGAGAFGARRVTSADEEMDSVANHVITTMRVDGDQREMTTYVIPEAGITEDLTDWLDELKIPSR